MRLRASLPDAMRRIIALAIRAPYNPSDITADMPAKYVPNFIKPDFATLCGQSFSAFLYVVPHSIGLTLGAFCIIIDAAIRNAGRSAPRIKRALAHDDGRAPARRKTMASACRRSWECPVPAREAKTPEIISIAYLFLRFVRSDT